MTTKAVRHIQKQSFATAFLKLVLHNTKSALKMDAESTGNGFRSGGGATTVSSMNLYIVSGPNSFDSLLKKMDNGVVISELAGMHAGIDVCQYELFFTGQGLSGGKRPESFVR